MESARTGIVEEATRVLGAAQSAGTVLRLLGGVAIYLRCPSARTAPLARSYEDIDFVGHAHQSSAIKQVFASLGYVPSERFNAFQGGRRLVFKSPAQGERIDVFLDVFEMCHRFDLTERLEIDAQTITLADLLATKLQVVETNEKDEGDAICLLVDHPVGDTDLQDTVNARYLADLCSRDWGIYKTFTMKLAMLTVAVNKWGLTEAEKEVVAKRVEQLRSAIERAPKSLRWKMRGLLGERVRWYELPEPTGLSP